MLVKLIDSVLVAKLRGKIDDNTTMFTEINAPPEHGRRSSAPRPQGTSYFPIL